AVHHEGEALAVPVTIDADRAEADATETGFARSRAQLHVMKRRLAVRMWPPSLDLGQAQQAGQPAVGRRRERCNVVADHDGGFAVVTQRDFEDTIVAVERGAQIDIRVPFEQHYRPPWADGMHRRIPAGHVAEQG